MTRPSDRTTKDKPPRGKFSHNPLVVQVIPALIALIGGYFLGARTGHVLGVAPSPTATVTVTQSAASTPSHGGGTPTTAGQEILHKTGVQLTDCYALSFTDPTLRPYQVPQCATFPSGDLSIDDYGDVQSGAQLAVYSGQAGFSQCQADTTYVGPGAYANPNHQRLTNSTLCITTANRVIACYVTDDTTSESTAAPGLTIDVTVYTLK